MDEKRHRNNQDQRVLIIDDDQTMLDVLSDHLRSDGFQVETASMATEGLEIIQSGFEGVILLDLRLPDIDGLDLLDILAHHGLNERFKVILITAHGTIREVVDAVANKGAYYVHSKSETEFYDRLKITLHNAFKELGLSKQISALKDEVGSKYDFSNIVTQSPRMHNIFRMIEHIVDSKVTVLIIGESGTGKELVARAIHYNGPRRNQPFIAINCAGIPETLLESELFGYERGAFTGAYTRKKGKFELADKGTLFLDEIGEMSLSLQAKLLRVLQEKKIERLGGEKPIPVDVRIISATNKRLEEEVKKGRFREDLYYRLSVFTIELPPLRERKEDIPLLARYFLQKFCKEEGKEIRGFTPRAMELLTSYSYPGNVRQLENFISHAVVVCDDDYIDIRHLPPTLHRQDDNFVLERIAGSLAKSIGADSKFPTLEELERAYIQLVLKSCKGNIRQAAKKLGISRQTLYRKLASIQNLGKDQL